MRFGWLTLSLSPSPEEDADRIDQQIEQVRFAERLGFGDVWLTEHYFTGESVYNDACYSPRLSRCVPRGSGSALPSCSCPSTTRCGSPSSLRCSTI